MERRGTASRCTSERLQQLAVSDTGFIFDPQSGQSFSVNDTGLFVLQQLKRGIAGDTAAEILAEDYGVPIELSTSSVQAFILQLERYL